MPTHVSTGPRIMATGLFPHTRVPGHTCVRVTRARKSQSFRSSQKKEGRCQTSALAPV